jgi:hypothetical protein
VFVRRFQQATSGKEGQTPSASKNLDVKEEEADDGCLDVLAMCGFIAAIAATDASMRTIAICMCALGAFAVGIVGVGAILIAVPFTVSSEHLGLASGILGSMRSTSGSVAAVFFSCFLTIIKATEIPPRIIAL